MYSEAKKLIKKVIFGFMGFLTFLGPLQKGIHVVRLAVRGSSSHHERVVLLDSTVLHLPAI